eukprot:4731233-Karenia_brevis.AAC.1
MDDLDFEWATSLRGRLHGACGREACHSPEEAPSSPRGSVDQIYAAPQGHIFAGSGTQRGQTKSKF